MVRVRCKRLTFLGLPDYKVGENGSVWSRKLKGNHKGIRTGPWKKLRPTVTKEGYHTYILYNDNGLHRHYVHRLVLLAFVGPPPEGATDGCHGDEGASCNHVRNLRWDSRKGNMKDAIDQGRTTKGAKNRRAKLTEGQVVEILRLRAEEGIGSRRIARMVGITAAGVQLILSGKAWKHVPRPEIREDFRNQADCIRGDKNPAFKVDRGMREKIKKLYATGVCSQQEIADLCGISQNRVSEILRED